MCLVGQTYDERGYSETEGADRHPESWCEWGVTGRSCLAFHFVVRLDVYHIVLLEVIYRSGCQCVYVKKVYPYLTGTGQNAPGAPAPPCLGAGFPGVLKKKTPDRPACCRIQRPLGRENALGYGGNSALCLPVSHTLIWDWVEGAARRTPYPRTEKSPFSQVEP